LIREYILTICLLGLLFYIGCAVYSFNAIEIQNVRIEDMEIDRLLNGNSSVGNLRAKWSGGSVDLYYDVLNGAGRAQSLSYSSEDEYAYSYQGPNSFNTKASIFSSSNNSEISWDEFSSLDNPDTKDLVFVIWANSNDKAYKDMVYIPGGSFRMGSKFNSDEKPKHQVTVKSFYLDKYEVTVAQFRQFCKSTQRPMPKQPSWNNDSHPVVNIGWDDANVYAKWAGKRLPTEAEWEYVARSGEQRLYYAWGNVNPTRRNGGNIADESIRAEKRFWKIWKGYHDGFVYTAPVGSFNPNQFGVYDMTGNVCEWCSDWYDAGYYKSSPSINPKGPAKGTHKVLRGGAWNMGPRKVLTTKRFYFRPDVELNYIGFRCAKD